ncbi:hypothetical protein [Sphingomonas sp.]|uniref:hypothetical protein n=1 Tax=Sphingomonas sp. TaxID=28214 RepID=UPI00183144B1|nr:hypothetical protein [Sphingomonas sp.]MBA4761719.1 hypothetical protein [Sphingomonas sp.]
MFARPVRLFWCLVSQCRIAVCLALLPAAWPVSASQPAGALQQPLHQQYQAALDAGDYVAARRMVQPLLDRCAAGSESEDACKVYRDGAKALERLIAEQEAKRAKYVREAGKFRPPSAELLRKPVGPEYLILAARELADCMKAQRHPGDCDRIAEIGTKWWPATGPDTDPARYVTGISDPDGGIARAYLVLARALQNRRARTELSWTLYEAAYRLNRVHPTDIATSVHVRATMVEQLVSEGRIGAALRLLLKDAPPSGMATAEAPLYYWLGALHAKMGGDRAARDALNRYFEIADRAERRSARFALGTIIYAEVNWPSDPHANPDAALQARNLFAAGIAALRRTAGPDSLLLVRPLALLARAELRSGDRDAARANLATAAGTMLRFLEKETRSWSPRPGELDRSYRGVAGSPYRMLDAVEAMVDSPSDLKRAAGEAYRELALGFAEAGLKDEAAWALRFAEEILLSSHRDPSRAKLELEITRAIVEARPFGYLLEKAIKTAGESIDPDDPAMIEARYLVVLSEARIGGDRLRAYRHARAALNGAHQAMRTTSSAEVAASFRKLYQPVFAASVAAMWRLSEAERVDRPKREVASRARPVANGDVLKICDRRPSFVRLIERARIESCSEADGAMPALPPAFGGFSNPLTLSGPGRNGSVTYVSELPPRLVIELYARDIPKAGLATRFDHPGASAIYGASNSRRILAVSTSHSSAGTIVTVYWGETGEGLTK